MRTPPRETERTHVAEEAARTIMRTAAAEGRSLLTEPEAKAVLSAYGIPTVATRVAGSPEEVEAHRRDPARADAAPSWSRSSPTIFPTSRRWAASASGCARPQDARHAAQRMRERAAELRPEARIKGFTVQPMITRPNAHELLIGVYEDRLFGPMILFGAGGTATEIIRDTAVALPPLDRELARDLMEQTRIFKLLEGYRDQPRCRSCGNRRDLGAPVAARGGLPGGEGARHQSPARRRAGGHRARRPHPHRSRPRSRRRARIRGWPSGPIPTNGRHGPAPITAIASSFGRSGPPTSISTAPSSRSSRRTTSASASWRRARSSPTSSSPASRRSTMRAPWPSWRWTRSRRSCSASRG